MEMNTRLQVEHPVTEFITGQDLVEWQLRIAVGDPLPLNQQQLQIDGHAFEARIYAEDPDNHFLPATGNLSLLQQPDDSEFVRVDTGVRQGDQVSVHYDPLIAKLICWDKDRDRALLRLGQALSQYRISGVTTNIDFLYNLISSAPFRAAQLDTGFIENHHSVIFHAGTEAAARNLPLAALYLLLERQQQASLRAAQSTDPSSPWHSTYAWRLNEPHRHSFTLALHDQQYLIEVEQLTAGAEARHAIHCCGKTVEAQGLLDGSHLHANIDGAQLHVTVAKHDDIYSIYTANSALTFHLCQPEQQQQASGEQQNLGELCAPMNGTIVTQLAKIGQSVSRGDGLLVMEAMKMEHTIRAPADGHVSEFYYRAGELVEHGSELLAFVQKES